MELISTYNNVTLPSFMYGTAWKKDATTRLTKMAVQAGFRAIDTANQLIHYDEEKVGDALLELAKAGITRDQLFLQTKFTSVNGQDHRTPYDASADLTSQVKQSMDSSLKHLHTDHLDSYVLHGPYYRRGLADEDWEVWSAIESLFDVGKTRTIGVSNVNAEQLRELCSKAKTKPMFVQNRTFASTGWDREVRKICENFGIIYQGFSLLTANSQVISSNEIRGISKRLGATSAQVIFRFAMHVGMLPLTGTTSEVHMREDLNSTHFALSEEDIKTIENIAL